MYASRAKFVSEAPVALWGGGVNRGMQIRRSVPFFRQIRRSAKFLFKSETTTTSAKRKGSRFKGKQLHVNGMVNFAQIVKKATCLMTTILITVSSPSLNELNLSKKAIIWLNSLTYRNICDPNFV